MSDIQEIDTSNGPVTINLPGVHVGEAADCAAVESGGRIHYIPQEALEVWLPLMGDVPHVLVRNAPASGITVYPTDTKLEDGQTAVFRSEQITVDDEGEALDQPYLVWYLDGIEDGSTEAAP